MSGGNHSDLVANLDAIEARHGKYATEQDCGPCFWTNPDQCTTLALVAEVRRLRSDREMGRTNLAYYSAIIDAQAGEIAALRARGGA